MRKIKKDILVTGGTGLVGKVLAKQIIKIYPKNRILFLVKDSESKFEIESRKQLDKLKIDYVKVDLRKKSSLKKIPTKPTIVIHMAANTETLESDHSVNDIGTINLFNAIKPKKSTHFIHISTVAFMAFRNDCSEPLDEDSPVYPTNEYCRTKLKAEDYLTKKANKNFLKLSILRVNTIYGDNVRDDSLFDTVNKMVKRQAFASRINWPGMTSIIHVDDVVTAILELSKKQPKKSEMYLLYGESLTMQDIFKKAYKKLKIKYDPISIPKPAWNFLNIFRIYIPYFEKILPNYFYNWIWRLGLITTDAAYCKTDKLKKRIGKKWNPKKLDDNLDQVFY